MRLEFNIESSEPIHVVIERDAFTGSFKLWENGNLHIVKSPFNPSTHFSLKLVKEYSIEIGTQQRHIVKIVHTRPLLFAGFRQQKYVVTVDGKLVTEYEGY